MLVWIKLSKRLILFFNFTVFSGINVDIWPIIYDMVEYARIPITESIPFFVGEFALVLRQKADRVPQVKADKGSSMGELGRIGGGPGISSVIDKYGTMDL